MIQRSLSGLYQNKVSSHLLRLRQQFSSVHPFSKLYCQSSILNSRCGSNSSSLKRSFSQSVIKLNEQNKNKEEEDIVIEPEEVSEVEKVSREGVIEETEVVTGAAESKEFQAETRELLDIVATALYTDKEVFIRELISNSSDALEKARQLMLTHSEDMEDADLPLEINISVDEKKGLFIIQDSGIGMSKEEMIQNIGTIAYSGSRNFLKQLREAGKSGDTANIIGQFGVGFYSIFMVADKVRVYSRSSLKGSKGYCWESVGGGSYTISEAEGVARGTKIVLYLKNSEKEFSMKDTVERIIKKYSNFVSFKISLNAARVNVLEPIWLKSKQDVTPEQYRDFFKFISHYGGDPMYIIHFHTDIPYIIHSLFFIPKEHSEKMGMGKMEPGVSVYCKKVLIQAKHSEILPEWLRFVKGVVDSEELPLNISREHLQDSPLIRRINGILTKKILRYLSDMQNSDRKKYMQFYNEYDRFIKEGITVDFLYKDDLAGLMIFETSKTIDGEKITLNEYIERMKPDQKEIYYTVAPNKTAAITSPYYEAFKEKDIEVILLFNPIDDLIMNSISTYKNKDLSSIERSDPVKDKQQYKEGALTDEQVKELSEWFKKNFPTKVESVTATWRLTDTPAVIKNPEGAAQRFIRKAQGMVANEEESHKLEVNPDHGLIKKIFTLKDEKPELAKLVAEQILDNALIIAGLLDDARVMVPRLQKMLETITDESKI